MTTMFMPWRVPRHTEVTCVPSEGRAGSYSGRAARIKPGGRGELHDRAARYKSKHLKSHRDQASHNGPNVWELDPAEAGRH